MNGGVEYGHMYEDTANGMSGVDLKELRVTHKPASYTCKTNQRGLITLRNGMSGLDRKELKVKLKLWMVSI